MRLALTLLAVSLLSGCATIFQHGPDRIPVDSDPQGANVYLDDELVGKTPMVIYVPHAADGKFRIEKSGFQSVTVNRDKVLSGWVFADLYGFPIGFIVDLATHNQGHYQEAPIFLKLESQTAGR